jgi:LytS/YehU family sensor histidine kinase
MTSIVNEYDRLLSINNHLSKHFIFNTLNSINSYIIDNDAKIATNYLAKFGKLLRLVIDNTSCETITLSQELEALQLYIFMERMRFSNKIQLELNVDANIDASIIKVPPFILPPLIEKAIWQTLASELDNNKIILDIKLKGIKTIEYTITEKKTNGKLKLQSNTLATQIKLKINNEAQTINKNSSLFNIEMIDLYNEEQHVIAFKTIISIPLNQAE